MFNIHCSMNAGEILQRFWIQMTGDYKLKLLYRFRNRQLYGWF